MSIHYQPIVIQKSNEIIEGLKFAEFFDDYQIEDTTYAFNYFCDKLTERFINGDLDESFTIEDIDNKDLTTYLQEIAVLSVVEDMIEKGFMDTIVGEDNEERIFLTPLGEQLRNHLQNESKKK